MTSSDFSDRVRNYPSARHGPLAHREKYRPGQLEKINDRKAAFDRLNRFIMARRLDYFNSGRPIGCC